MKRENLPLIGRGFECIFGGKNFFGLGLASFTFNESVSALIFSYSVSYS